MRPRASTIDFTSWHDIVNRERLAVLCDLDGTLIPFAETAAAARLDDDAAQILRGLDGVGAQVVIVSGRPRKLVDAVRRAAPAAWWFAEHGAWRFADGEWQCRGTSMGSPGELVEKVLPIVERVDGARLERKTAGICVHWRQVAEPERPAFIERVTESIAGWLANHPAYERLPGVLMVEVRPRGLHKGVAVAYTRQRLPGVPILAIGDDVTDEDMFRALGERDVALTVGRPLDRRTHARVSVADVDGTRRFLRWLMEARAARSTTIGSHLVECPAVASDFESVGLTEAGCGEPQQADDPPRD
jgi:trehalose-phosphatase